MPYYSTFVYNCLVICRILYYTLKRQEQLGSWLSNPCIPIDNNQVERAIRPVTVGRKNSLFIGVPDAGKRATILYTMVEECKRTGRDFLQWLTEVLRRLPTHRASESYWQLSCNLR